MVAGDRGDSTPKPPFPADKGYDRAVPLRCRAAFYTVKSMSRNLRHSAIKKPSGWPGTGLKNGGNIPIKTLNVVTGPPDVGEVSTSNGAS